jgi:hypothetical protein
MEIREQQRALSLAEVVGAGRLAEADSADGARLRCRPELQRLGQTAACNLACACGLQGDRGGYRRWLQEAKAARHLPSVERLRADPNLAAVRGEPWFAEFLT